MEYITNFATWFIGLFQAGSKQFVNWVTTIVPLVLIMLVFMNALIALIGEKRINKFAQVSASNPLMRYMVLPFLSAFMLGNPLAHTMGKFLPEYYKPSYYASCAQFCHTSNGVFPHINPAEYFIWMGIASGVQKLGLNIMDLAIRYLLVGLIMNFIGGWITDYTTAYVCKTTGISLSKQVDVAD
ncbi:PTS glucitol/sorbitol transporter subunit IIC [Lactobacillus sp. ESL0791]|uniref:PTS glucitol/sorbitol transporter subunit IIC n=1 Tax=Lactobacillus sp. ESL0791 TaxID=2983234 RepID=UPI0023F722A4|nr:PTS glucitol/sorbitol transporter subunit IIC [Lactobacillus sp. ESL0791]MDF7638626.1 PTS glucitol/sorbitol transporter subunit IIC [Lactobacillus sp. ESL0791]